MYYLYIENCIRSMLKVITFLFFQVWILVILNGSNFLEKFYQKSFKIKDFRAQIKRYNKNMVTNFEVRTYKYNRSIAVCNGSFTYAIDIVDDLQVIIQAYKFASNEYRIFPIHFQINVCEALAFNIVGIQKVLQCGNITSCYFKKNVKYFLCNFFPDPSKFPPHIPNGMYMIEAQLLYNKIETMVLQYFLEIYTPTA